MPLALRKMGMTTDKKESQLKTVHDVLWSGLGIACVALLASGLTLSRAEAQTAKSQSTTQEAADASRTHALSRRVEQLEEQVVDLQVVIGTLESLATTGAGSSRGTFTSAGASSNATGAGLESHVRALSAQVEKLSAEVRALQNGRMAPPAARQFSQPDLPAVPDSGVASGFGATTVNPSDQLDAIGTLIEAEPQISQQAAVTAPPPEPQDNSQEKAVYQAAYAQVLQQDYAAAQAGFREFLRKYPKHALVPNALYWLGETYYVQENYTDAAEAFDIVTAAYGSSNKAPDSQLKRGMSLANLGKRSEACSVFQALAKRYPNAPTHVKSKAEDERQRVGCS